MRSKLAVAAESAIVLAAVATTVADAAIVAARVRNTVAHARLTGKNEVSAGDTRGRARARIALDGKTARVCWRFTRIKRVARPTGARLDRGRKGKTGPVVVALGSRFKKSGCVSLSRAKLAAIQARPKAYYVNIMTGKFPMGAVRGQL
jgi:hypothetical protein